MSKFLVAASRFLLCTVLLALPAIAIAQPALSFPWDLDENPWQLTQGPHDWPKGSGSQSGLDFDKDNTPRRVLSMFDGVVTKVIPDDGPYDFHNSVLKVKASDGSEWALWYLHMSKFSVSEGTPVRAGDLLGYSGKVGDTARGVHLHVELLINGKHASWWGKSIMGRDSSDHLLKWDVSHANIPDLEHHHVYLYSSNDTLPPINPMQTWTEDANNNHKTSFARGDPIRYVIEVRNVRKDQATATFRFRAGNFFDWQGSVTVPSGLALYYSPSYIPTNASPGTYDYTVLITYTGPEIDCKYCNNTRSYGLGTFRFTVR